MKMHVLQFEKPKAIAMSYLGSSVTCIALGKRKESIPMSTTLLVRPIAMVRTLPSNQVAALRGWPSQIPTAAVNVKTIRSVAQLFVAMISPQVTVIHPLMRVADALFAPFRTSVLMRA